MLCWAIPSESKTRNRSDSVWTEKEQSDATAMPRLRANFEVLTNPIKILPVTKSSTDQPAADTKKDALPASLQTLYHPFQI